MLTKVFQYSLIFNKQFMIPIVALGMCLVGKNAYLGICRLGKVPRGKMPPWENAALGMCHLGKCLLGKMPPWENAALGSCHLGSCRGGMCRGESAGGEMS